MKRRPRGRLPGLHHSPEKASVFTLPSEDDNSSPTSVPGSIFNRNSVAAASDTHSQAEHRSAEQLIERAQDQMASGSIITELDFHGSNLTAVLASAVSQLFTPDNKVATLDFSANTLLGSEGLSQILTGMAVCTNALRIFRARKANLDDSCAKKLGETMASCTQLSTFDISGNFFTALGSTVVLEALLDHPSLTSIAMSHNLVGDEGAQALGRCIEKNDPLQTVDVSFCRIYDRGAIALGLALAHHPNIKSINIGGNHISSEAVDGLSLLLEHNTALLHIGLTGIHVPTVEKLRRIAKRNKASEGPHDTAQMNTELARLYLQKHKLGVAQDMLKEQQQATALVQDVMARVDGEFSTEREEVSRRVKRTVDALAREQRLCKEYQDRQKDATAEMERFQHNHQQQMEILQERLHAATVQADDLELQANDVLAKMKILEEKRDTRLAELKQKVQATRQETAELRVLRQETQKRIAELRKQSEETNGDTNLNTLPIEA
eukprot:TRINITY_DN3583_c0_g1_i1.p1 TRINITY_DN3583_c0_g1~~TRINITY_DN3583_c0_g1_i1.p1  ORF type:complete len:503 (-),score=82.82 TRINITY_DN3583_c0_g1_i1:46-1527(-)